MPQKLLKSAQYIELGSYQYWPVIVPRGIRLYTYEQIPGFLRENPYITDGYRAYLTSRLCIKSLLILSNETVNIWSHLLGFLMFLTLALHDMTTILPATGASREDYVIHAIGLFCFQVCVCVHVVLGGIPSLLLPSLREDQSPLDGAGLCWNLHRHLGMLCAWGLLRLLLQQLLAAGVPGSGVGHDASRVPGPDPPAVPEQAVAKDPLRHLLLCRWLRPHSYNALGMAKRGHPLRSCPGICSTCSGHVRDRSGCLPLLRLQSSGTLLPRPAELPGCQSPAVAHAGGSDVLLVAPVRALYH
ncbi:progestin and adipoQ receptor family member 3a isoform X2 [Alosa alosa]|uniref:progestin and adipoQ receptor family member 3a isoform X2 n=1 Tax=Alosa alosa TaxID=278164 RepID=UPI00201550FB|nr:progestin and adipoQ receptor family member 3a isoform X2 [Alosa alosa]